MDEVTDTKISGHASRDSGHVKFFPQFYSMIEGWMGHPATLPPPLLLMSIFLFNSCNLKYTIPAIRPFTRAFSRYEERQKSCCTKRYYGESDQLPNVPATTTQFSKWTFLTRVSSPHFFDEVCRHRLPGSICVRKQCS